MVSIQTAPERLDLRLQLADHRHQRLRQPVELREHPLLQPLAGEAPGVPERLWTSSIIVFWTGVRRVWAKRRSSIAFAYSSGVRAFLTASSAFLTDCQPVDDVLHGRDGDAEQHAEPGPERPEHRDGGRDPGGEPLHPGGGGRDEPADQRRHDRERQGGRQRAPLPRLPHPGHRSRRRRASRRTPLARRSASSSSRWNSVASSPIFGSTLRIAERGQSGVELVDRVGNFVDCVLGALRRATDRVEVPRHAVNEVEDRLNASQVSPPRVHLGTFARLDLPLEEDSGTTDVEQPRQSWVPRWWDGQVAC